MIHPWLKIFDQIYYPWYRLQIKNTVIFDKNQAAIRGEDGKFSYQQNVLLIYYFCDDESKNPN